MNKNRISPTMSLLWAKHLFACLTLLLLPTALWAGSVSTVVIHSQKEWNDFADDYDGEEVNVKLECDVTVSVDLQKFHGYYNLDEFKGTFDGQGHTLYFKPYSDIIRAPFVEASGTIKNLRIISSLEIDQDSDWGFGADARDFSPLVMHVYDDLTIENCYSEACLKIKEMNVMFPNYTYTGGFISQIYSGKVTFKDCAYVGDTQFGCTGYFGVVKDMLEDTGGFVGHIDKGASVEFTNCFSSPRYLQNKQDRDKSKVSDVGYFVGEIASGSTVTTKNCYAYKRHGKNDEGYDFANLYVLDDINTNGSEMLAEESDVTGGKLAVKLAANRTGDNNPWRQTLGTDAFPIPKCVAPSSMEVFKADGKTVNVTGEQWQTVFYPAAISVSANEVERYVVTGTKDGKVLLSKLSATNAASVPMVIHTQGTGIIVYPDAYYNKLEQTTLLRGTYSWYTLGATDYYIKNGRFVHEDQKTIDPWTCYLANGSGSGYDLDTSSSDIFLITSKDSWNTFKTLYNNTEVKAYLDCDLTLTADDVAMENFKGTLDGQGHSIVYDFDDRNTSHDTDASDNTIYGFIKYAEGTIKNLNITGSIKTKCRFIGGPLAWANYYGTLNVENCHSDVSFCTTYSDLKYTFGSGFMASTAKAANFTDCSFTGSFTSDKIPYTGGFVGEIWYDSKVTFTNCYSNIHTGASSAIYSEASAGYFVGTMQARGSYSFTNCYAHNSSELDFSAYSDGAIIPTDEQLQSGEVTFALNNGRDDMAWAQTIGTDGDPQLKTFAPKSYDVKKATGTISKNTDAHWATLYYPTEVTFVKSQGIDVYDSFALENGSLYIYENLSGALQACTPALLYAENGFTEDIKLPVHYYNEEALTIGTSYLLGTKTDADASSLYLLSNATADTPTFAAATGSTTLPAWQCYTTQPFTTVSLDGSIIYSKDDWNTFKTKYNNKRQGFARLACDLTLTDDDAPMQRFLGTFDGQGHTITVNYANTSNQSARAPFYRASGTIRNLNINGTITHAQYNAPLACCIIEGETLNVENCHSSVTHTRLDSDTETSKYGTGFISYVGITPMNYTNGDGCCVNFKDCSFTGGFKALDTENDKTMWFAGFVTNLREKNSVNFENCLSTISSTAAIDDNNRSDYFVPVSSGTVTSKNCYAQKSLSGNGDNPTEYTNNANVTVLSPEDMKSGKVTYLLNAGRTGDDAPWRQTVGTDTVPVLKAFSPDSREVHIAADTIKIGTAGWSTHYYPLPETLPDGVKAYTVSGVGSEDDEYIVNLKEVTGTIPAYTPVLLCTLGEGETEAKAITIEMPDIYYNELKKQEVIEGQAFQLVGVARATPAFDGCYVLQQHTDATTGEKKTAFYSVDTSIATPTIPAWKCVLVYNEEAAEGSEGDAANAKRINLRIDDEATGISNAVRAINGIFKGGAVYDLEGRRVQSLQKGHIYIKNGQKFIVR